MCSNLPNHALEAGKSILLMPLMVPLASVGTAVLVTYDGISAALSTIKALGSFFTNGSCCGSDGGEFHAQNLHKDFNDLTGNIAFLAVGIFNKTGSDNINPITNKNCQALESKINTYACSSSFFHRHITARLGNTALLVAALVTQAVNIAIGLIALVFAVAAFGESETLNEWAQFGCQSIGGTVATFLVGIAKIINPQLGSGSNNLLISDLTSQKPSSEEEPSS